MFPEHSDVATYGLAFGEAAVVRVREAPACAFCNRPPIDVHGSDALKLAWLDEHEGLLANLVRAEIASTDEACALDDPGSVHPFYGLGGEGAAWRDQLRRLIWDSQLDATLTLPLEQLDDILARCDDDLREFACDRLVFAVCGFCRSDDALGVELAERLRSISVCEHYEGNAAAAKAQPAWHLLERILALIETPAEAAASA